MKLLKEIKKIAKETETKHGVNAPNNSYQITKTGISKLTGKETLSIPLLLDIFIWIDDEIVPVTPFLYFKSSMANMEKSNYEFWVNSLTKLMKKQNSKKGYYIVNHGNMRTKYLGIDWNIICDELNGKYASSNPDTVLSEFNFCETGFGKTVFQRKMNIN